MSIELMKKLEDLEQSLSQYYKELSNKISQKKMDYIKAVVNDYSKFFEEKGFKVTAKNRLVEATYGKLKATLTHEEPSTDFVGVLFRFDIDLSELNKSNLTVALNRSKPGLSASSAYSYSSEEERLSKSISQTEIKIKEVKNRLENFENEHWSLFVKDESNYSGYQQSKPYTSMYELLNELIK